MANEIGMVLKINDRIKIRTISYFNNFSMELKYDSLSSTFAFAFYFDPNDHDLEELSCVSHYHEAELSYNGQILITGYIITQGYKSSPIKSMVQMSGYSKAGNLGDCQIPPELYPLESIGLSLSQIAVRLLKPFKLDVYIDPSVINRMNLAYEKTTAKETQTIQDYLQELATQRNIIMTHDTGGDVFFTSAKTKVTPVLTISSTTTAVGITPNTIGITSMALSFNGQALHSHITVIKQADEDGGNAGQVTIQNPFVPIIYRPKVVVLSSGDDNSIQEAAQNELADELRAITLTVVTDRWEFNGKILQPNNVITVYDPDLYLYKTATWFIESISFTGDSESTTAVLKCVLPCVYDGSTPVNIFVDAHTNRPTQTYGVNG